MVGHLQNEQVIARDSNEVLLLNLWRKSPERTRGAMLLLLGAVCGAEGPGVAAAPAGVEPKEKLSAQLGGRIEVPTHEPQRTARGKIRQRAERSDKGVKRGPRGTPSKAPLPQGTGGRASAPAGGDQRVWDPNDIFNDLE
jgi:hypothetical protein